MLQILLLLLVGFYVLIKGASWLVDGSVGIARRFKIDPLIIGLTIVAFGTSMPELVVNVISALSGDGAGIGLGNIIGSNIANIGLIIGASALLFPLVVKPSAVSREMPLMLLSSIVFAVLVGDRFLSSAQSNLISTTDGVVLLLFFAAFIYYLGYTIIRQRKSGVTEEFAKEYDQHKRSSKVINSVILVVVGIAAVVLGGKLVVDNAAEIARVIGISEIMIGLTVIAIGTSLPELSTAVVAAMKKEPDIAVGNIVGSNIFNTFFILGINAVINPIPFQSAWFADIAVMVGISLLLFVITLTRKTITRREGTVLLAIYVSKTKKAHPREQKARLALEIVSIYHGEKKAEAAAIQFEKKFAGKARRSLGVGGGRIKADFSLAKKAGSYAILDLLVAGKLASSKSEARRKLSEGAVEVDGEKVRDPGKKVKIKKDSLIRLGKRFLRIK